MVYLHDGDIMTMDRLTQLYMVHCTVSPNRVLDKLERWMQESEGNVIFRTWDKDNARMVHAYWDHKTGQATRNPYVFLPDVPKEHGNREELRNLTTIESAGTPA